jgi:hypothetical protein
MRTVIRAFILSIFAKHTDTNAMADSIGPEYDV